MHIQMPLLMLLMTEAGRSAPVKHVEDVRGFLQEQFPELIHHDGLNILPGTYRHQEIQVKEKQLEQPRFPLPGPIPIDTEQIKKIAQLLTLIGDQILPGILSPSASQSTNADMTEPLSTTLEQPEENVESVEETL